jgi:hypothetical protein
MTKMATEKMHRPRAVIALVVLHVLLGVGAVGGAAPLIVDPTGRMMGVPLTMLDGLPFCTFLVPAIVLAVTLGVLPLVVAFGLLTPRSLAPLERLNPFRSRRWPFAASLFVGVYLVGWTAGEMVLWGWVWLSAIYLAWGVATVVLTTRKSSAAYLAR